MQDSILNYARLKNNQFQSDFHSRLEKEVIQDSTDVKKPNTAGGNLRCPVKKDLTGFLCFSRYQVLHIE